MSVQLKSPEDIAKMRVAGRLAAELLDYLTPHVQAGHHDRRDRRARARLHGRTCSTRPGDAQLRAARAFALPGFAVHVGQPRRVPRHPRRQEAEGRRHRQHRRHRDQGRLSRRHEPHVLRRHAVDPGEAAGRASPTRRCGAASAPCSPARISGDIGAHDPAASPKATASRSCASSAATASGASSTRSRRCCTTAGPAPGSSCSRG